MNRQTFFRFIKHRKAIIFTLIIIVLICYFIHMHTRVLFDFCSAIKNENISDLTLTIYYCDPTILSNPFLSVEELISAEETDNFVYKVVVTGKELDQHIKSFYQINHKTIKPAYRKSKYIDASIYYVLESKKNGKIFDVLSYGISNDTTSANYTLFFNGFEIKENPVFFEVIAPFLTAHIR